MEIYTSYYAKMSKSDKPYKCVQVSNTAPDWFSKPLLKFNTNVSPSWNLINLYKNGQISREEFCTAYRNELESRTAPSVLLEELHQISGMSNVVLLCFEKELTQCHREVLADFLNTTDYKGEL